MTAQPIEYDDPRDPSWILAALPARMRPTFLAEYESAVDAAHDPERYRALSELLQHWSVRAQAFASPGYTAARAEALGPGPFLSLEDIDARRAS